MSILARSSGWRCSPSGTHEQHVLVWIFVGACNGEQTRWAARDDLPPPEPDKNCSAINEAPRPVLGDEQIKACPMLDPDQVAGWIQNMGNDNSKCRQASGTAPMREALSAFILGDGTDCDDIIARSAAADRCIDSLIALLPPTAAEQRKRLSELKGAIPSICGVVSSHVQMCPANTMQTGTTSQLQCVYAPPIAEIEHVGDNPVAKASCELDGYLDYVCTCSSSGITRVLRTWPHSASTAQYAALWRRPAR